MIAEGVRFIGDIAGDGNVEVHGRLQGAVHIGGELRVGPKGIVKADVVAARVRVDGRLDGRVRATQQVVIGTHGCLVGEVQGLLAVEEGGVFRGQVELESPDLASTTIEAPPVVESWPGQRPQRLEPQVDPPRLRLPQRRRSATTPSTDRETLITRKMPQVRGDSSHSLLPTDARQAPIEPRPPSPRPAPAPRSPAEPPPASPVRPQSYRSPTPASPPGQQRTVTAPHPPRRPGGGRRNDEAGNKPRPGDPVDDREDLSDEWFEEEDYLLKER